MHSKLAPYTLTDAATVDVDWNNSQNQELTPGGNRTLTFSNGVAGSTYTLKVTQDATGSRTLTHDDAVLWAGGTAPTLTTTANAVDVLRFYFDGTNYIGETVGKAFA